MTQKLNMVFVGIAHTLLIISLTIVTQIGGAIYLGTLFLWRKSERKFLKRTAGFLGIYGICTLIIIPMVAPLFGRVKLPNSDSIHAHSYFYVLANRTYVKPELAFAVEDIADELGQELPGLKLVYLDANFPFIDGFPLLPHLSHNDGKKLDISFIYAHESGEPVNEKPSRSGYGVYEAPSETEVDQPTKCRGAGYWQYDFPKYLTGGTTNPEILFSAPATQLLCNLIVDKESIGKLFIEPHLKHRLNLNDSKVRFHGCQAVRHDDHIHFQLQ